MESFQTRLNKTSYTISFVDADTFYSHPKAPQHLRDKIQSLVWAQLVAPKGPNFRGRKVRKECLRASGHLPRKTHNEPLCSH